MNMNFFDTILNLEREIRLKEEQTQFRIHLGVITHIHINGSIRVKPENDSGDYVSYWLQPISYIYQNKSKLQLGQRVLYCYPQLDLELGFYFSVIDKTFTLDVIDESSGGGGNNSGLNEAQVQTLINNSILTHDTQIKNWVTNQNYATLLGVQTWVNSQGYTTLATVQTWVNNQNYTTLGVVQTWVNSQGYTTLGVVQTWVNNQDYTTLGVVQTWVNSQNYTTLATVQTWVNSQNYATQSWVINQNYITASNSVSPGNLWRYGSWNFYQGSKNNNAQISDSYCDRHITITCSGSRLPPTGGTQDALPAIGITLDGAAAGLEARMETGTDIYFKINTEAQIYLKWANGISVNGVLNSNTAMNTGTHLPMRTCWKLTRTGTKIWTAVNMNNFDYIPYL